MVHSYKKKKYILSTRNKIDAENDSTILSKRGFCCHVSSSFEISKRKDIQNKFEFDSIVITSKNAIEFLSNLEIKNKPIFCVGSATAKRISKLGFNNLIIGKGDSKELAKKIICTLSKRSKILWPTQNNASNDFQSLLKSNNFIVEKLICYDVIPLEKIDEKTINLIKSNKVKIILFYSIFSAKIWLKLIKDAKLNMSLNLINAVTISKEVSNYLSENSWLNVETAKRKNMSSVLAKAIQIFNL